MRATQRGVLQRSPACCNAARRVCNAARRVATQRGVFATQRTMFATLRDIVRFPLRCGFGDGPAVRALLVRARCVVFTRACCAVPFVPQGRPPARRYSKRRNGDARAAAAGACCRPVARRPPLRCLVAALSAQCSMLPHIATQRARCNMLRRSQRVAATQSARCNMLQHSERAHALSPRHRRAVLGFVPPRQTKKQTNQREQHGAVAPGGPRMRAPPLSTRQHPWASGSVGEYP